MEVAAFLFLLVLLAAFLFLLILLPLGLFAANWMRNHRSNRRREDQAQALRDELRQVNAVQRERQGERHRLVEAKRRRGAEQGLPVRNRKSHGPGPPGDSGSTIPTSPKELRAVPYWEYLQTPHWKRKREEKLRAVGRRCQVCNHGPGLLEVHHRTYERLGQELDEDLTVLCRACHSTFHEQGRLSR